MRDNFLKAVLVIVVYLLASPMVTAEVLHVASAANFKHSLQLLIRDFNPEDGHRITISSASTGTLYAQAIHGAPFDILLAADALRPEKLEQQGYAVKGSRITYAYGQLALVYQPGLAPAATAGLEHFLAQPGLSLAIANPDLAPYGIAAAEVLARPALRNTARTVLRASNVMQAYQMLFSGGADAALVARSLVESNFLPVPPTWHMELRQQAVLMQQAANKPLAREFMDYLQSAQAHAIIRQQGYLVGEQNGD
jgi:molybdate transport system substrate-binding protein